MQEYILYFKYWLGEVFALQKVGLGALVVLTVVFWWGFFRDSEDRHPILRWFFAFLWSLLLVGGVCFVLIGGFLYWWGR